MKFCIYFFPELLTEKVINHKFKCALSMTLKHFSVYLKKSLFILFYLALFFYSLFVYIIYSFIYSNISYFFDI